jgi:hypothetical protein
MSALSFMAQAGALACAVAALHIAQDRRQAGAWPNTWRQWREIAASVVLCVALFALISGGRGCAPASPLRHDSHVEDAPDPFGR